MSRFLYTGNKTREISFPLGGNEFECGSNYARSMASYALLNAFAGFSFDIPRGRLGFHPLRVRDGHFRCFWSLASGWGSFLMRPGQVEVRLLYGKLALRALEIPGEPPREVSVSGRAVAFVQEGETLRFPEGVLIEVGESLVIRAS